MADESIKSIRERVKELIKLSKITTEEGKEAKKQLETLRARLKAEKNLSSAQKKNLDTAFKMSSNEELRLKLAVSESKEMRNVGKILDKQLTTNVKIAKGEMSLVDIVKMKLQQKKALRKSDDLAKKAVEARAKGLDEEAAKYEDLSKNLKEGVKLQKEKFGYDQKADELADDMIKSQKDSLSTFTDIVDKAKNFTKMLAANPMKLVQAAALAVVAAMVKMVMMMRELQKEFGFTGQQTAQLQGNLMEAGLALRLMGISGEEIKQTAGALMEEFGGVANATSETLTSMGMLHATLGIAGADAAKLLGMMESVSGASRETLINQIKVTGELARAAGVAPAAVMADVAANTDLWADFAKDGGDNITEAAIQAKALGLNLGTVSKMADSLLDFETSIQASMEASMMIGRNINTDRARQLALDGDLAGMQKEILSQVGSEAEFNNMNRLQREAMAKAFGLSTAELSKMVREQETLNERFGFVTWFLEKLAAVTGLFRSLRPILETMGVIFGIVLLPLAIKLTAQATVWAAKQIWGLITTNALLVKHAALTSFLTVKQWLLNAAMSANPIGLIVLGVVALIAGIVLLAKKIGGFGKLASIAFKMAFAPLFLAWEVWKKVGQFIGGLFGGGGEVKPVASPAVSMAKGGIVTKPTTATIGDAGPEAAVPLGNKFDLTVVEEKLDQLIAQDAKLMNTLTKKVGDMGVNG